MLQCSGFWFWKNTLLSCWFWCQEGGWIRSMGPNMTLLSWSTIIQLKFFPEHLARNQCPGDSSPAAVVKSLSATLSKNDKDHLICAACCLRFCFECYQRGRLPVHRCFSLYEMICGELFLLLLSCTESHPLLLQPVLRQCHWSFSLFDLGLMNHGLLQLWLFSRMQLQLLIFWKQPIGSWWTLLLTSIFSMSSVVDHFYIVLFSALKQTCCALVACDSK